MNNIILVLIPFLLVLVTGQKTYHIQALHVQITVPSNRTCSVQVMETYKFLFQGGTFTSVNMPIQKDATRIDIPLIEYLQVTSNDTIIENTHVLLQGVESSAAFIQVKFQPVQGNVTFVLSYVLNGYLWSTRQYPNQENSTLLNVLKYYTY
jgi:hypothetical protein